ncbi:MAG: orotidine-5'-phosphate decarboxylase [Desulfobacteraceae bacterium]
MARSPEDYLVFPLDLSSLDQAMAYVRALKDRVGLFKIGLELFAAAGPSAVQAVHDIAGPKVFLDLKLHDIPETIRRAFLAASIHGPKFITVHCDQGEGILKEVAQKNPGGTMLLGITLLTSLGPEQLRRLGYSEDLIRDLPALVVSRARLAMEAGCHGVVCSGREVAGVKQALGREMISVTPGIRPSWSLVKGDDQKRMVTPAEAVRSGADYIVVGRPIRDASDPAGAASKVAEEISTVL